MTKKRGVTLTENLVAIVLVSILVITTIGGFVIAKMSAIRAKHRTFAMSLVRQYIEKEVSAGYNGGQYSDPVFISGTAVSETDPTDGMTYSVVPYAAITMAEGVRNYKIIGFRVIWNEPIYGGVGSVQCSERMITQVADHG